MSWPWFPPLLRVRDLYITLGVASAYLILITSYHSKAYGYPQSCQDLEVGRLTAAAACKRYVKFLKALTTKSLGALHNMRFQLCLILNINPGLPGYYFSWHHSRYFSEACDKAKPLHSKPDFPLPKNQKVQFEQPN